MSQVLRHTFSNLSPVAIAILDEGRDGVMLGTLPPLTPNEPSLDAPTRLPSNPGKLISFETTPLDSKTLARLETYAKGRNGHDGKWTAFLCQFDSGRQDRIAVHVGPDANEARLLGFLTLIWPVLREDCLREIADTQTGVADEAMLWFIAKKMELAVFVVNAQGMMLRTNAGGKYLLNQGHVLKRTRQGIACSSDAQTKQLRDAIAACALADPEEKSDAVVFLTPEDPDQTSYKAQVPVTLSRFFHEGAPTSLVTMVLPSPPDSRRVETLARKMGLTQSEARVAALMQLGLSNREAARLAGLTEQSLRTYAKRVLSKLNVTSRAEVAQMLTWQAQGGPVL